MLGKQLTFALTLVLLFVGRGQVAHAEETHSDKNQSSSQGLTMVVMDPLAAPLSCPCVEGYAQRKYEKLAEMLEAKLGQPVHLLFNDSLESALENLESGQADLIIGKDSVVRADVKKLKLKMKPVARLTGKEGTTTQNGLFVVRGDDPAKSVKDLKGYRIIFGPADCQEKHQAAIALLKKHGVPAPEKLEIDNACSDGAAKVVELGNQVRAAAVISSYAQPLLEGCGTIKKGDLRVVGTTEPVPFVTAFVSDRLSAQVREQLKNSLLSVATDAELVLALETLEGFVAIEKEEEPARVASKKK